MKAEWKIHTSNLLREIINGSGQAIYHVPLVMLGGLLHEVATRASELNDPKLNHLMMRLTLYAAADPESPHYNKALVEEVEKLAAAK